MPTARWVISTPTGGRVDPEVYCRWETSSTPMSTGVKSASAAPGISSMTMTRGRRPTGSLARKASTAAAAATVVSTTLGWASVSAVSRRSAWPGSSGANNGTAMPPALMAAKNPAT